MAGDNPNRGHSMNVISKFQHNRRHSWSRWRMRRAAMKIMSLGALMVGMLVAPIADGHQMGPISLSPAALTAKVGTPYTAEVSLYTGGTQVVVCCGARDSRCFFEIPDDNFSTPARNSGSFPGSQSIVANDSHTFQQR